MAVAVQGSRAPGGHRRNLRARRNTNADGRIKAQYASPSASYCAFYTPIYPKRSILYQVNTKAPKLDPGGIGSSNRALLERLHQLPAAFGVEAASAALGLDLDRTRQFLAYLARRGWLSRVRRGLYVAVPLDARRSGDWVEDPWVVAERSFSPCYIGGWSACQHWGFTDQVFRTVLVLSGRRLRHRELLIQGTPYRVTVRSEDKLFGTVPVWRQQTPVQVSDPTRTVVDILDDPTLGGGIRHVADVLREYTSGEHRDDDLLIAYADRLGNRAVFKRLGFILERTETDAPALVAACLARRSTGLVALDPSVYEKGRIVRRWGIRDNAALGIPGGER